MAGAERESILDGLGRRWHPGDLSRDEAIAALAARQLGLISGRQLHVLGLDAQAIRRRVRATRLFAVGSGVFAVGHPAMAPPARLLAAALAYRPGAVVSHRSALAVWRLQPARSGRVDVVARTGSERSGTRLHRIPVDPADMTNREGVPVTAVGRTLADAATVLRAPALERAVHEAQVLGLLTGGQIRRAASASTHRAGGARLRGLLEEIDPEVKVRSHLERRFLACVRAEGLPRPRINALVAIGPRFYEIDVAWPSARLAVELDSRFHDTPTARRADARRDRDLADAGWRVVRLRSADIHERPVSSWIPSLSNATQDGSSASREPRGSTAHRL